MKISTKLFMLLLMNMLVVLLIAGFAYFVASGTTQKTVKVLENDVDPLLKANAIEQDTTKIMLLVITHLSQTDPNRMTELEGRIQQELTAFDDYILQYKGLSPMKDGTHHKVEEFITIWVSFQEVMKKAMSLNRNYDQEGAFLLMLVKGQELFEEANQVVRDMVSDHRKSMNIRKQESEDLSNQLFVALVAILLLSVFYYSTVTIYFQKILISPIKLAVSAIDALGHNDLTFPISSVNLKRRDEIGDILRAYFNTQNNLSQVIYQINNNAKSLGQASDKLNSSSEHMTQNSKNVTHQAATIASSSDVIAKMVNTVASAAEQASTNVFSMTQSFQALSGNINSVAKSADQAATNMSEMNKNINQISQDINQVAGSVEGMSASLVDVSKSTKKAMEISKDASRSAQLTLEVTNHLGNSANQIGRIVKLIGNIATQTNMLALNATIEAASAGEAGKGFAVVAAEVKDLAQQTAEANNEIAQQIEQVQNYTNQALQGTQSVSDVIRSVSEINQSIAGSIERQSQTAAIVRGSVDMIASASKESALNVHNAVSGLQEINRSVAEASDAAKESVLNLNEAAVGVKEIARSSAEVAGSVNGVNQSLQSIQLAINDMSNEIANSQKNSSELAKMSATLIQSVSSFNLESEAPAEVSSVVVSRRPPTSLLTR
ncbi:methyl-accepting chemotaxis protein [Deltaproteobacteria bacterium TL4]